MDQKKKRNRIPVKRVAVAAIPDPIEFTSNLGSPNAKKVIDKRECVYTFELWHDKHYHLRHIHGDDQGKRNGIDPDVVGDLVIESIDYLITFSATQKGFKFVNLPGSIQPESVILRRITSEGTLNVVVVCHYKDKLHVEITVKTAMFEENFRVATGQYVVDFQEGMVILQKKDNISLQEVASL